MTRQVGKDQVDDLVEVVIVADKPGFGAGGEADQNGPGGPRQLF